MNIKMVDLYSQYNNIKSNIDQGIQDVLESSAFINGPQVSELKKNLASYLKCKHVITCANGTDALQIALMALNIKQGDEVILPDFTFIATAEVIALLKLKPVFVDVDPRSFLMDVEKLKKAITKKTKVIIPVHLYGQCANMEMINKLARDNNLFVIEDNAQALGSDVMVDGEWKKAGTVADIGCTSFFPSKNLGCFGDGGAIFTNDDNLSNQLSSIANHGAKVKYYHDIVGVNSRLDTLQAAILLVKLQHLDTYNSSRKKAADIYDELLSDLNEVSVPYRVEHSTHVFHQYTILVEKRDELKAYLSGKGIPSMIYYPVGMHNQTPYKAGGDFTICDSLCKSVLSLPMHTELKREQQEYIVQAIKDFYTT